jgi:hypothetical protein
MRDKISITLLFIVVVAVVMLFGATQVMAQERPQECNAGAYTLRVATDVPFPNLVNGSYEWNYDIICQNERECSKINKLVGWLPSSPPFIINVSGVSSVHVRGSGDPSTNVGEVITNGFAFTIADLSGQFDTRRMTFVTDVGSTGLLSIGFNTGSNKLTSCLSAESDGQGPLGGIIGPGFDAILPERSTSVQTFTITEGDVTCIVEIDEGPPLIITLVDDDGGACTADTELLEEMTLNGEDILSLPLNVWIKTHASPGTFRYCYPSGDCVRIKTGG